MSEAPLWYGRSVSGGLIVLAQDITDNFERYSKSQIVMALMYFSGRATDLEEHAAAKMPKHVRAPEAPRISDVPPMPSTAGPLPLSTNTDESWGGTF